MGNVVRRGRKKKEKKKKKEESTVNVGRRIVERISIVETRAMFPERFGGFQSQRRLHFEIIPGNGVSPSRARTYHVKFRISFPCRFVSALRLSDALACLVQD